MILTHVFDLITGQLIKTKSLSLDSRMFENMWHLTSINLEDNQLQVLWSTAQSDITSRSQSFE